MRLFLRHPLRVTGRLLWFAGEIFLAWLDYVVNVAFRTKLPLTQSRALWLQQTCRRLLRILNVKVKTRGPIPLRGLLVSNHLGYLDIIVLSSICPAVFVSRDDVRRWPVLGWCARLAGTLFVRRTRRTDVARLNRQISDVLETGVPVVLFPEGTSSDGGQVLPFKSALLEPVRRQNHPVAAALIRYFVTDGRVGEDVCYWGDMAFLPHLLRLLSKSRVRALVSFTPIVDGPNCRKALARRLHSEIVRMKEAAANEITA